MGGYTPVKVGTNSRGRVDIEDLKSKVDDHTVGMMLTQPNTLGLFEDEIETISQIIHDVDGLMYMDGANLNALLGISKPFEKSILGFVFIIESISDSANNKDININNFILLILHLLSYLYDLSLL